MMRFAVLVGALLVLAGCESGLALTGLRTDDKGTTLEVFVPKEKVSAPKQLEK